MMIMAMYNKTNVSGLDVDQVMFFYSFPDRETEDNIMDYLRDNENIYDRYNYFDYEILNNCFILYTTKGFEWLKKIIDNIERIANGKEPLEIKIDPPIKVEEKKEEKKKDKDPKYTSRVVYDEDERRMHVYFGTSPKEEVARILFSDYFDSIAIKNPDYEILVDGQLIKKLYWEITIISYTELPIDDKKLLDNLIEEVFAFMSFKAHVCIDKEDQILVETAPITVDELYYFCRTTIDDMKNAIKSYYNDKDISLYRYLNLMVMDEYLTDLENGIDDLADLAREKK